MAAPKNDTSPCVENLDDLDDSTDANLDDADFDAEETDSKETQA
jgi:hypothetical protein